MRQLPRETLVGLYWDAMTVGERKSVRSVLLPLLLPPSSSKGVRGRRGEEEGQEH